MRSLLGQRLVITGGGSGLGRATALAFAARGWRVLIGDLDPGNAQATADLIVARGGQALACACDVRTEDSLLAMAERAGAQWQGFDVWINNAGVACAGFVDEGSLGSWHWTLDINLLGCVRGARAAIPTLRRLGGGHIVNVASFAGIANPPGMGAYNASSAAVISLSETLRYELFDEGIGVSVACPAFFRSNLLDSSAQLSPPAVEAVSPPLQALTRKMMNRSGVSAADVAEAIVEAVLKNRFLILTHRETRWQARLKRWFPNRFFRRSQPVMARVRRDASA